MVVHSDRLAAHPFNVATGALGSYTGVKKHGSTEMYISPEVANSPLERVTYTAAGVVP